MCGPGIFAGHECFWKLVVIYTCSPTMDEIVAARQILPPGHHNIFRYIHLSTPPDL